MTISRTLLVGSMVVAATSVLLTAIIVATAGYFVTKDEIEKQNQYHLSALRSEQKEYISSYLKHIKNQMVTYSTSYTIQSAANDFINAFKYEERRDLTTETEQSLKTFYRDEFGSKYKQRNPQINTSLNHLYNDLSSQAKIFQDDFIAQNPNPLGEKDRLSKLPSNSIYSRVHEKYHPEIRKFLQTFSYYDIFIIDAESGNIIYSVFKELDFATSLIDGPYKNTGLAEVFNEAKQFSNPDKVSFSAFKSYTPSYEDPAAFIASPVIDKNGDTIAVLAFQMPIDKINEVLTRNHDWENNGLGETGETYLVAENYKAQSLSRFLIEDPAKFERTLIESGVDKSLAEIIKVKETNIGYQEIKTSSVMRALDGNEGFDIIKDYRNVDVISAYSYIDFEGARFAILAEMDKDEAHSFQGRIIKSTARDASLISFFIIGIVALIAWRFSKLFSLRLNLAVQVANGVAQGEKVEIDSHQREDEIGSLMNALNKMQTEVIGKLELAADESNRITSAIEAASTNIMMADADFTIIYMNPSVRNMMKAAEEDLKKELPNFDANNLLGQNIDVFHKNPAHQRSMLDKLRQTYKTEITVGKRTFSLIATPIFSETNERLGTVVEWDDKTAEVHIEKEVESLIKSANSGDLSKRLDTAGQQGFVESLSTGLNQLMDQVSGFVTDVGDVFEAMSSGNLTKKISNSYTGQLETIKNNANGSVSRLTEVLSKIQNASDIVRSSSHEVAQGADDLSRRTESQASSLEETAASMEEIAATVKQTAESTTESNSLASEAKLKAEKGGAVVQGAVKAMADIIESSNKINDIIGVIDEIAFQTNLLALNAAVEAARAGEQGRGFAVVAGEVRTLSQRSAAAAKEIKNLIRDSVSKVESGSNMVNQSGKMLSEIVHAVGKVASMIADVNHAAIEQNSGIGQINQAITQMDEMTQQNAALVEETSAASRSMSEEAISMSSLISFFQLSQQSGASGKPLTTAKEPIQTYKPAVPSKPAGFTNTGAASFSNDDDWEDF